ncbi:MAG: hypothetical protein ACOCP6_00865 [Desulfosalsimonas sp.]
MQPDFVPRSFFPAAGAFFSGFYSFALHGRKAWTNHQNFLRFSLPVNKKSLNLMAPQKVQYLRYVRFLRISRTAKYAAFFGIAQALILNFLRRHLKMYFLRNRQISHLPNFSFGIDHDFSGNGGISAKTCFHAG